MLNGAQAKIEGINFDSRKNLIDYDSVLSSQRELIYKQRDEILLGKRNGDIIKKMVSHVAKEIVDKNLDPKNDLFVIPERISAILNKMIFNAEVILPEYFKRKASSDAIEIIAEIIKMSIDIRIDQIGQQQAERILRDILLQNLDYQ
jgi:preprotein translocase subunit SecA